MKKGDATMVATVLLIVMAIVTGVLVMSFSRESEKKVEKKIINLGSAVECQDVGLGIRGEDTDDDKVVDTIKMTNRGTLGIDKIILRIYVNTGLIASNSPYTISTRIKPGETVSYPLSPVDDKIEFIPIIIVNNDEIGCESKIVTWENK